MLALETIIVFAVIPALLGFGIAHFQRKGNMDILNRQRREQAEKLSRFQAGKKEESAGKKAYLF